MNTAATTTTDEHADSHDHEHHDPRLAHHFDSHQQQLQIEPTMIEITPEDAKNPGSVASRQ